MRSTDLAPFLKKGGRFALACLSLTSSLLLVDCDDSGGTGGSSSSSSTGAGTCADGVVIDGVCSGKCTSDKCLQPTMGEAWSNTCVTNACQLVCATHDECAPNGSQDCVAATKDEDSATVSVCQANGKLPAYGVECPQGTECGDKFTCPSGEPCGASNCGGDATLCVRDGEACRIPDGSGGFKTDPACTKGRCVAEGAPFDGAVCHVGEACAAAECQALRCTGAAPGDAYAFCTRDHCEVDTDCPGGWTCGTVRDPHAICGTNPVKGDNGFCGSTTEACIDPADFAKDGASFFEGSLCLLKKSCVKRSPCMPCATDLDCSALPNQKCVQIGADKRCASDCGTDKDCPDDYACTAGSCTPRFGACEAPTSTFCAPCVTDEDCGKKGSTWGCADLSSGGRGCFDEAFPDTCTTDADCPTSPSGIHGTCLNESFGVSPGDSIYQHCYLPLDLNSNKTSCW